MNNRTRISLLTISIIAIISFPPAFADYREKLDFAAGLEETLGHFWALELNLDEGNAELQSSTRLTRWRSFTMP